MEDVDDRCLLLDDENMYYEEFFEQVYCKDAYISEFKQKEREALNLELNDILMQI